MMSKKIKYYLMTAILFQCISCLVAGDNLENLNTNLTDIKLDLWPKNVTYAEDHKSGDIEVDVNEGKFIKNAEMKDSLKPITMQNSPSLTATNRTGRQLFYSPIFFFIQNYGAEGSKCVTSYGSVGVCTSFDNCAQIKRHKRHSTLYNIQPWVQTQHILPYFKQQQDQRQQEFCQYYDQYLRSNYGICCTGIENVMPEESATPDKPVVMNVNKPEGEMQAEETTKQPENSEDSEVLEADLSSYQPEPPTYDNTDMHDGNNIDYDPIENLKKTAFYNNFNNYIRYPWSQQFIGLSGVQQWPLPLPTHPPSISSWPPPIPTHPPNHHYPTHPPLAGGGSHFNPSVTTTKKPISITTTRRPTYPNYPTQRPPTNTPTTTHTTTTTTTTTTKKPVSGGSTGFGLPLQCGIRNLENPDQERIVGGTNASPHEFPWITVLFKSGKQFCGGSLITNNHILTAAHCVARMTSWDVAALTAHLGDYNIRTDFEVKHITRRIKRLVRHRGFDFSTLHNDIAILTLNEPVKFTNEISPICLPTSTTQQSRSYSGHIGIVAGWGSLRENGPQPSILQKVQIPIWTNSECAQKYGRAAPAGIIESMICAGQVAKDSCSGDSGGPLIVNDGAHYIQVGIVSWGIGCGKGQYPGVYTRVTSLLPWIYKNIK